MFFKKYTKKNIWSDVRFLLLLAMNDDVGNGDVGIDVGCNGVDVGVGVGIGVKSNLGDLRTRGFVSEIKHNMSHEEVLLYRKIQTLYILLTDHRPWLRPNEEFDVEMYMFQTNEYILLDKDYRYCDSDRYWTRKEWFEGVLNRFLLKWFHIHRSVTVDPRSSRHTHLGKHCVCGPKFMSVEELEEFLDRAFI